MGIPAHRYVTQRRLIFAQSLLRAGKKPSKIYSNCGYKDYSSFYKAYCLHFGYPPSCEGKGGSVFINADTYIEQPIYKVPVADTAAAAMELAARAAAITVSRPGVSSSIPVLAEVSDEV